MNRVIFMLKNPREFLWEPIRKRLFKARQLRTERDYWYEEAHRYADNADFWRAKAEDYEERYNFQWEMRCKAEDELAASAMEMKPAP